MASEKKSFSIKKGVSITDEVVAIIAGLSATEVEGVASLEGNLKNKAIEKTGMTKLSKGVKIISKDEDEIVIRLAINIEYGREIQAVCAKVQQKVKSTVENMTGMSVAQVDVKVSSVILDSAQ